MNDDENIPVERAADERLVHALLTQLHDTRAAENRDVRLRRVLTALKAPAEQSERLIPPAAPARRTSRWVFRSAWAAAAALLIVVGIWALTYSTKTAYASLNDILGALSRPGDRTFRIRVEPQDPGIQPMAHLDGARLYLRDGKQYLLERPDPAGGLQYDGFDGRQSWRINSGRVVEIKEGLGAGGVGISTAMSAALYENLQAMISQVGADYTVEKFEQAIKGPSGVVQSHVRARHKPGGGGMQGPPVIEIWSDAKTGMPQRIVFEQDPFPIISQPRRMIFELQTEAPLPADWFSTHPHTTNTTRDGRGM